MLYKIMKKRNNLVSSGLYNQDTFYNAFLKDLNLAKSEVIIESPFITAKRMNTLLPLLEKLISQGVKVIVNTKPTEEQDQLLYLQSKQGVVSSMKS